MGGEQNGRGGGHHEPALINQTYMAVDWFGERGLGMMVLKGL